MCPGARAQGLEAQASVDVAKGEGADAAAAFSAVVLSAADMIVATTGLGRVVALLSGTGIEKASEVGLAKTSPR